MLWKRTHCILLIQLVMGTITLADPVRPEAADTVAVLKSEGITPVMLTGDARAAAEHMAGALGIERFLAEVLPEHKVDEVRRLMDAGEKVVMVGDGINDAPVLAGADVSVAPSHAASLAQSSADVLMLGDTLHPVVTLMRGARRTMRIVRQNLAWAIVYNLSAVPLAAAGLVPPWLAAIGMSTSSLVVVLNALRLSRIR